MKALRVLADVLLALAVTVGLCWLFLWVDIQGGSDHMETTWPEGLETRALVSGFVVFVPGAPAFAGWLRGASWAHLGVVLAGVALVATSWGWGEVGEVGYVAWLGTATGVGLLVLSAFGRIWERPPAREGNFFVLTLGLALLVLVIGTAAWSAVGMLDWGLLNHHEEDESGLPYLVPFLLVAVVTVVPAVHVVRSLMARARANRDAAASLRRSPDA